MFQTPGSTLDWGGGFIGREPSMHVYVIINETSKTNHFTIVLHEIHVDSMWKGANTFLCHQE